MWNEKQEAEKNNNAKKKSMTVQAPVCRQMKVRGGGKDKWDRKQRVIQLAFWKVGEKKKKNQIRFHIVWMNLKMIKQKNQTFVKGFAGIVSFYPQDEEMLGC